MSCTPHYPLTMGVAYTAPSVPAGFITHLYITTIGIYPIALAIHIILNIAGKTRNLFDFLKTVRITDCELVHHIPL